MNPSDRLLRVMEYLMLTGQEPVKQVDLARNLDIAPATLNRIMKVLSDHGYVFRTSERFVVPNFRLMKNVPMSAHYLEVLDEITDQITQEHGVFSEVVVVAGQDLFWHSRTTLNPMPVAIRARAGYRRPLYELDAMSRLYLGRLGWEAIDYQFNVLSFHSNAPGLKPYSSQHARQLIEQAAKKDFDYDFDGNRVGLRRFAIVVDDLNGNFLHFLTMAEAALPVNDREERIESRCRILEAARARLVSEMKKESQKALIHRRANLTTRGI